ncbi:MAG: PIG-L deacetylase family protein [Chloroflexota bacterium]
MDYEREPFYIPERALVIAAHADDIEFGASGTVARWTDAGAHVTYCIVTDSGAGNNDPGTDLEQLKKTRIEEQRASAHEVGVEDVIFLQGYADGTLEPTLALRKDLTRVIRQVRPNVVLTFDPETVIAGNRAYINHPDHRAVAEAARYAVFPSAGARPIFMDLLDEGLETHEVDRVYFFLSHDPDTYIDITRTIARKANALRCHPSQFDEKVVQMVMEWNAEAGKVAGVDYAERFRTMVFRGEDEKTAEGQ